MIVFAIAFALGTLRMFVLLPWLGATRAVLLELPVLLAVSWAVAGWCVGRFAVPRGGARVAIGLAGQVGFAMVPALVARRSG